LVLKILILGNLAIHLHNAKKTYCIKTEIARAAVVDSEPVGDSYHVK